MHPSLERTQSFPSPSPTPAMRKEDAFQQAHSGAGPRAIYLTVTVLGEGAALLWWGIRLVLVRRRERSVWKPQRKIFVPFAPSNRAISSGVSEGSNRTVSRGMSGPKVSAISSASGWRNRSD